MALRIKVETPPITDQTDAPPDDTSDQAPEEGQPVQEEETGESMAGGALVDPAVARYLGPEDVCQNCVHFMEPGSCEIVAGPIHPQGRCSLFTADIDETPNEDEAKPVPEAY